MFEDWLKTDVGKHPKTWETLLKVLDESGGLKEPLQKIKDSLEIEFSKVCMFCIVHIFVILQTECRSLRYTMVIINLHDYLCPGGLHAVFQGKSYGGVLCGLTSWYTSLYYNSPIDNLHA